MSRKKRGEEVEPKEQVVLPEAPEPAGEAAPEADVEEVAEVPSSSGDSSFDYHRALEEEGLRTRLYEVEKKLRDAERRVTFWDRLGVKLFGLTPAERFFKWDATPQVLSWQERVANTLEKWQDRANDFVWSTIGSLWDALPPTLRPAIIERHLPHYRWCISRSSGEIFLSGTAYSAEKATEEAQTITAILKGVFEVIGRGPGPVLSHTVYFENGTKVIPEINTDPTGRYRWATPGASPRVVSRAPGSSA